MITDINQLDLSKSYTYADYLTWQFAERVELIKGKIFKMSPAPSRRHQAVSRNLQGEIYAFLKGKPCQLFDAPFDVKLSKGDEKTVVQPDICVICDELKLTDQGCTGAPDLIVEILSPGNTRKEMKEKFELYEENGVLEYWMVNYSEKTVFVYYLQQGKYIGSKPFVGDEKVATSVLNGFVLTPNEIFRE